MLTSQCELCHAVILGDPMRSYRGRSLCNTCYEVRHLVDGMMIDVKIDKVEFLIETDGIDSFMRGFTEIN